MFLDMTAANTVLNVSFHDLCEDVFYQLYGVNTPTHVLIFLSVHIILYICHRKEINTMIFIYAKMARRKTYGQCNFIVLL